MYALSLKQPWAALLVHGLKTIEVRRWTTQRRGLVLIHAARVPDSRPAAWKHVTPELETVAGLTGGILGVGILSEVRTYRTLSVFEADRHRHLNEPEWFAEPGLYGLLFERVTPLPFHRVKGNVKFFRATGFEVESLPLDLRAFAEETSG